MAVGGRYFSRAAYTHTLQAVVSQHFYSAQLVSSEAPMAPIVLFKLLFFYKQAIVNDDSPYKGMLHCTEFCSTMVTDYKQRRFLL